MPVVREGLGPYAPVGAVLSVIDTFRDGTANVPFTTENLPLSVTPSLAPRTLQALRLLDLVDDDGNPTRAFHELREASPQEFPDRLAAVVRAAYAEVFSYRDPVDAAPEEIIEAFRRGGFRPASVRDRMVRLFYGLCEASGIIEHAPRISKAPRRNGGTSRPDGAARPRGSAAASTVKDSSTTKREENARQQREDELRRQRDEEQRHSRFNAGGLSHLHPALAGLLATVPPADEPWPTRERYENFKTAFDATLQVSNPVPREREGEQ